MLHLFSVIVSAVPVIEPFCCPAGPAGFPGAAPAGMPGLGDFLKDPELMNAMKVIYNCSKSIPLFRLSIITFNG